VRNLSELAIELEGLIRQAVFLRAPVDAGSIAKSGQILRDAYRLGRETAFLEARHEHHDGAWEQGCSLCDAERQAEGLEPL
jgi:hypothetical protein